MPGNSAEYMRQYRQNNSGYTKRNNDSSIVRNRALTRLAKEHPKRYEELLQEEKAKFLKEQV